jgi:hypothetical protein
VAILVVKSTGFLTIGFKTANYAAGFICFLKSDDALVRA